MEHHRPYKWEVESIACALLAFRPSVPKLEGKEEH